MPRADDLEQFAKREDNAPCHGVEQRVVSACVAGLALATGNVALMSPWPGGLREAVPPKGVAWRRIQAGSLMECSYRTFCSSDQATTRDCAHSVPDSLQWVPRAVCSFNFASKVIASLSDYAVSLHAFISLSGLEVEGPFSASTA